MATTYTDCITFTGETSDFTLTATNKEWDGTVEYSTDHETWTVWSGTEISSSGKKLYLRGSGNTKFYTSSGARFVLSAKAACSGNIQTLLEYSNPPTSISVGHCYREMFSDCTNLTKAPELPATTLTTRCYESMFYNCTSLTEAPELPATTLASNCYNYMFWKCTSLTQAPALPATTLASYCYGWMFNGCTSLTQAPSLPATTLADWCYYGMFLNCTSLTTAPKLPATTLAESCYYNMFKGCTSLKISTTQSSEYPTVWRIPSSGTISSTATNWNLNMLSSTGGTSTSDPLINTTYYGAWSLVETYNISYNLTNCTGASTNPTTIDGGTTATLSFASNDGYSFPDEITVSGVESYTWDKSTGTLTLTNATSDVSITITCIVVYPKINSFTYHGKQINNINGKPIRYVHHSGNTYEMVYALPQLATPQNVTADGTTVSWDEVENATSYAVLADGNEIGTVEKATENSLAGTWVFNNEPHFSPFTDDPSLFNLNLAVGTLSAVNIRFETERVPMMSDAVSIVINDGLTGRKTLYYSGSWQDEAYKTITITSKLAEVTNGDTLLAWLQANATKQGTITPTLISFTIAGTSYQAEEGMTWEQWVASSYNTGGFYITAGNTRVIFSNGADYVSSEGFAGDYANNTSQIVANGTYYKFSSGGGGN